MYGQIEDNGEEWEDEGEERDSDFVIKDRSSQKNNTMDLTNFVQASSRALSGQPVGSRILANMATGLMKDIAKEYPQLDPVENPNLIIGRGKVRSQRKKFFKSLTNMPLKKTNALSWDGKQSEVLEREGYGDGKMRNTKKRTEMIVVTDLQNKEYVGDFKADSSNGKDVGEGVAIKAKEKGIALSEIDIISSDSTANMTGFKGGRLPLVA